MGIINFNHTDSNYNFDPAITGNGSVNARAGTTLLTGTNSYKGGTNIAGGTLRAGSPTALPANTPYTINSGTLDLNGYGLVMGRLTGTGGTIDLGSASLLVDQSSSSTFSGAINGFGALTKKGSGTLTLNGTSYLFFGETLVQGGHLAVNGSLAYTDVRVTGGSLGGTGAVGGIVVESGGTIAPGTASIGRLNAARNVRFEAGSTYEVTVNPSDSDLLWANGTATLNGGTVKVLAEIGSYQPSAIYTILTAAGGVRGSFAGVSSNFAFLDPSLSYTSNDVRLTLVRKTEPTDPTEPADPTDPPTDPSDPSDPDDPAPTPVAFNSVAVSANQYNVANAVEALGSGNSLYDAVIGQSVTGAREAFDSLSGEAHWYSGYVPVVVGQAVQQRLLEQMRPPLITRDSLPSLGTYPAAYASDRPGAAPEPVAITLPVMAAAPRYSFWGEGFGSWGQVDGNGNAASLDSSTGGFILGAETRLTATTILGLAGGFSRTTFDVNARLSSGSTDSVFGALYGSTTWGDLALRLGASYAWNDMDVSRTIRFPGFADSTHASYDGFTALAFAELGYRLALGAVQLEPFVGASVLRLHADGFQEEGGPAALTGYAQDQDLATTTLGLRAEARLSESLPLTVRGLLGWRHTFGDVAPESLLAFAGGQSPFTVEGTPLDRDVLVAEAGLDWQASDAISLGIAYSGQVSERAQEHSVKGSFVWRFGTH